MSVSSSSSIYPSQQLAVTDLHYVAPPTVAMADDHYLRGVQAVRAQDYLAALHHFGKATFLAPNEPLPFVARAEAYTHLCDLRSAITSYRKAVALMKDPVAVNDLKARLAQVLDAQGVSSFREGQSRLALRYAEESLSEHYHSIAELHKVIYLIALQDNVTAETILTSSLLQRPEVRADATVLLVEMNINLRKDFATAKMLLENILAEHGKHPRVLNAERFFDTAFIAFKNEAEASLDVDMLTKCVLAFPEDATLYQLRASGYCNKKMYTSAVQDLFASITKSGGTNPKSSAMMTSILSTIASELSQINDNASAVNYFTEALKWDEYNDSVLLARGDCQLALGKHEEALRDYSTVLMQDSSHRGAKQRLAHLHDVWGTVLFNQAKYELAEAEFSKAIQLFDEESMHFYHRAQCRFMLKHPEFAVRDLLSCRELHPTDPEVLNLVMQFCAPAISGKDTKRSEGQGDIAVDVATVTNKQQQHHSGSTKSSSSDPVVDVAAAQKMLQAPTTKTSLAMLSQASATLSTEMSSLEDKFNPIAIRDYVKQSTTVAESSSVVVIVNPVSQGRRQQTVIRVRNQEEAMANAQGSQRLEAQPVTSNDTKDKDTAGKAPNTESLWKGSSKKLISRFDRFDMISKQTPIPHKYHKGAPQQGGQQPPPNSGRNGQSDTPNSLDRILAGGDRSNSVSYIPVVEPPSLEHRSKLSGSRSAAILSATAPSAFIFTRKATLTVKPSLSEEVATMKSKQ